MDHDQSAKAIEKLQDGVTQILVEIGKIQVEMRQVATIGIKQDALDKSVVEISASARSAHKRIDSVEQREKEAETDRKWLVGTILGIVGVGWKLLDTFSGK
jgi:phosphoglycerate dehydrogenase-like enzyme